MINYEKFLKSLTRLEDQHRNYQTLDPCLDELIKEAIKESVIQRFETCYDSVWKVLKRYLIEELGLVETPNSPKPVLRLANENGLLEVPIERWLSYTQARIDTAHDYDGEKAEACLRIVADFIDDAKNLHKTMSE